MFGAPNFGCFLDNILEGAKDGRGNPCANFCLDSSGHPRKCGCLVPSVNEEVTKGLRSLGAGLYRAPRNTATYHLRKNARAWVVRAAGVGYAQEFVDSRFLDLRSVTQWRRNRESDSGACTELTGSPDRGQLSHKPDEEEERRVLGELCTAIDYHLNKLDVARSLYQLPATYNDAPWYVHLHAAAYRRLPTAGEATLRIVALSTYGLDIALCIWAESDGRHPWARTIYHLLSERPCYGALCHHEGRRWTEIAFAMLLMFAWFLLVHLWIELHVGSADGRLTTTNTVISSCVSSLRQVERLPPAWRCLRAVIRAVLERGDQLTDSESTQVRSFLDLFEDNFVATYTGDILEAVHEYDVGAVPKEKVGAAISAQYAIPEVNYTEPHADNMNHCRCRRCNLIKDALRKLGFLGQDLPFERRVFDMYAHTTREYDAVGMFINNTTRMRLPLIHVYKSMWLSRLLNPVIDNICARLAWVSAMGLAKTNIDQCLHPLRRPGHRDRTLLLLEFCQAIDRHLDKLGPGGIMAVLPVDVEAAPWSAIAWLLFTDQVRILLLPILWKVHWWIYGESTTWRWIIDLPLRVLWTALLGPILAGYALHGACTLMYHLAGNPPDANQVYELAEANAQLDYHGRQICVAWALLREAATQLIESNFEAGAEEQWQQVSDDVLYYAGYWPSIDTGDARSISVAYADATARGPLKKRIDKEYELRYKSRVQAAWSAMRLSDRLRALDEDDDS